MLKLDEKEIVLPETIFSRDIETKVIQIIIWHCLEKSSGISLTHGKLIDSFFGRDADKLKGIYVEQDIKNHLVKVKIEVNIDHGISIPEKTEEIQNKLVQEISMYTGLHVASIHIIVKGINLPKAKQEEVSTLLIEEETIIED